MNYTLLPNGKLDDNNTHSEYERGYIDCYNKYYYDIWRGSFIYTNGEWILLPETYMKYKDIEP